MTDTANDNNPLGTALTLEEEIGHAVMHLAMHENGIRCYECRSSADFIREQLADATMIAAIV